MLLHHVFAIALIATSMSCRTMSSDVAATNPPNPSVTTTTPANGATDVHLDFFVSMEVRLPNVGKGVDSATLTSKTVSLSLDSDKSQVVGSANTSGGGDVIVFQPEDLLKPNADYTFTINGVADTSGALFKPLTVHFKTGTKSSDTDPSISFTKVPLPTTLGKGYMCVVIGPDHKLYASTLDGEIRRFEILSDGTLSKPEIIRTLISGGERSVVGLAFDPKATASNLILWATHTAAYSPTNVPADFTGKLTRLEGDHLQTMQDYLINLPRSVRDHLTNQPAFGPDGAIYFPQASNSAMGAPDNGWGLRPEHQLTASILRFDPTMVPHPPLDVKTNEGGSFSPFANNVALTLYATGVRNAYDIVFHSNGHLYAPTNGSAAGGATPSTPPGTLALTRRFDFATKGAYTGPIVPGIARVSQTEHDWLFKIEKGGYYGHPNPSRTEFVMNGGNPTNGTDAAEILQYPVGTKPDRNYRGFTFDFGAHYSPNGVIEYKGNAFNGKLTHRLLITRYSGGKDIIALTLDGNGDVASALVFIKGLRGFHDPLDLIEDTATVNIYVSELASQTLTLLKPN